MHKTHVCQLPNLVRKKRIPNINEWQILLKKIRDLTTISEDYPLTRNYFRSFNSFQDEKHNHISGTHWLSIHPFSSFQYYRQFCMVFIYVLLVIWDSIDIAYLSKMTSFVYIFDSVMLFINIVGLIDTLVNFFLGYIVQHEVTNLDVTTGYYNTAETTTVLSKRKIAIHYLRTFFIIDSICVINIFHLLTDFFTKNPCYYFIFACIRHIRLIRIYTAGQFIKILLTNVQVTQDVMIILQCLFFYVFFSFYFGSLLVYVPELTSYIYNEDRCLYAKRLEIYYAQAEKTLTSADIFLQSTFEAFYQISVNRTKNLDLTVEIYIIIIAIMVVGLILRVFIFISIFAILSRRYKPTVNHIIFMQEVTNYVKHLNLNKQLSLDVYHYFDIKLKNEYFQESHILSTIERKKQYEIFSESSMGFIRNCQLFKNLPDYFIVQLSLRLKCETYVPGVTVITVGEIATCMYFIATGTVAVYSADGTELCHLSDGEYVGEIGILQSTARVADIVTIEHCELYRLDIRDFQEVIKPNSKFYKRIYKIAMKRMNVHVTMETDNKKSLL